MVNYTPVFEHYEKPGPEQEDDSPPEKLAAHIQLSGLEEFGLQVLGLAV